MAKRIGGHLVAESLTALGAEAAFGVPGIHALPIWEGLREGSISVYGTRTELAAGFAADGYARSSGHPAPLFLSTGPGALNSLTALMEAASSHVPVVAISSQIPSHLIGRGRGYLHELPDQLASFAPIVKDAARAHSIESIPGLAGASVADRAHPAQRPGLPRDPRRPAQRARAGRTGDHARGDGGAPVRAARAGAHRRQPAGPRQAPGHLGRRRGPALRRDTASCASSPSSSRPRWPRPTWARARSPPITRSPPARGATRPAFQELLSDADVVLCVGTELGAETTAQYGLRFSGQLIHLDAAPERIGVNYSALPLVGDAKLTLLALVAELSQDYPHPPPAADAAARVTAARDRIRSGLQSQGREIELGLLETIEQTLPADAVTVWDMTILAYWAAPHLRLADGQQFLYPMGSGTLGYAWPAAIGARVAHPDRPVLGVMGDGGLQYTIAELGTAAQHDIAAKLLVVDDGGYGILREYQRDRFGQTTVGRAARQEPRGDRRRLRRPGAHRHAREPRRAAAAGRSTRRGRRWSCCASSSQRPSRLRSRALELSRVAAELQRAAGQ